MSMEKRGPDGAVVRSQGLHVSPNPALPQLSCEHCRERKTKCDKLEPCTNCVSAGVTCVPVHRLRLPRGRHVHHPVAVAEDLKRRIRRLHTLVSDVRPVGTMTAKPSGRVLRPSGDCSDIQQSGSALPTIAPPEPRTPSGPEKQILLVQRPDDFWADLAEEIHGLRDVIESAPGEAENDSAQTPESAQLGSVHRGISILGLSAPNYLDPAPQYFVASHNKALASRLCQIYLQQVDPIVKILHRPTLKKFMLQGEGYLGYPEGHVSMDALSSAVIYSAASSMTENQCQALFQIEKPSLMADCRRACEAAIDRSGILTTRDITVLQAFVLYLVARRSEERSTAVWTLLAVVVRIAKALSLNLGSRRMAGRENFFVQQMRKRLWLTICLMDLQASFGQASQPLIAPEEATSSYEPVGHINDSDFDLATTHAVPDRKGLTDTTFAIVKFKLQLFGRLTNFGAHEEQCNGVGVQGHGNPSTMATTAAGKSEKQTQQQHAQQFEQEILHLMDSCDPESSPYAWFTVHSVQCFMAGARAYALRPLLRLQAGSRPLPPRTRSDTELLRLGTEVLEKALLMYTDPRGEGFRWYVTIPWHALAITIAECSICSDADLVRRVWPTVEASYRLHEAAIERPGGGRLRGPLGKLMDQSREKLALILQVAEVGLAETDTPATGRLAVSSLVLLPEPDFELGANQADTFRPTDISSASFDPALALQPLQQQTSSPSYSYGNQTSLATSLFSTNSVPANDGLDEVDQSWRIWEEFVSDISFDDFSGPDPFFGETTATGT